jgi:hypothetical protein
LFDLFLEVFFGLTLLLNNNMPMDEIKPATTVEHMCQITAYPMDSQQKELTK